MVSYAQLWQVDPAVWRSAGASWARLAVSVGRRAAELGAVAGRVADGWRGAAGSAAGGHVRGLREPLDAARLAFVETDQVLSGFASALVRARGMLAAAVAAAAPAHVEIDRSGRTAPDVTVTGIDRVAALRAADRVGAGIAAALAAASAADEAAAADLARLGAAAAAGWPVVPPRVVPPLGAPPGAVRLWWSRLTDAERRWLLVHQPTVFGRLDGVPVAARDQANRSLLAAQRADLMQQRAEAVRTAMPRHGAVAASHRLVGLMSGIDAVDARLASEHGERAYLVGLSTGGYGRLVLAVGDPDEADNVLTYVPGMTADLTGVRDDLGRVEALAARAAAVDPTQRTSTVLWLDYDAPSFLDEAMTAGKAREAAPGLHRFAEGLRATHEGPPAQHAVLGHSYGSLTVGTTVRTQGLAADDLIFVGSPGVGADRAADLGVPPDRVWASTASDDPIGYLAPGWKEPFARLGEAVAGPFWMERRPHPNEDLWFGRNPTSPSFGAQVFTGDPHGHSGYWRTDNDALTDIARIALGPEHQSLVE
ncbi:alpha/beta hydrolase [Asanoa sp. WMMD1127]|uniref:alpha/beta hydrolase n=1 Tax=Asanoa sp. WMMD1127 TaxID=3016107 RepID=UPI0024171253|nr:alpha/beta hydrolase [Asanoa sp. WMMD1127]MDG4821154.1 alpha/beta hydrolase [Asanoa sp. WMMD1127]